MQFILDKLKGDRYIWSIAILLLFFSLLAVYSASSSMAFNKANGNTEYFLFRQFVLVAVSFVLMFVAHRINYNYYARISLVLLWIAIPLLAITLFLGANINDASRWLRIPILGVSFQTSDLAKLAIIMYTASMLSKFQHSIKNFEQAFLPILIPILLVFFLIVPANLSTALLVFTTCWLLMFVGRIPIKYLINALLYGCVVFSIYLIFTTFTGHKGRTETWKQRIEQYVNGTEKEESWQVKQAKVAIAKGGLIGVMPGNSEQRNFLPNPYSDYIYAIIVEEYGFLGGLMLITAYLILLYRSIRIFAKSPGAFGALLAFGLSLSIVIQALLNIAITLDLVHATGLVLPLVSMGGTSLLFTSLAIGIILSVSRHIEQNMQAQSH